MNDDIIHMAQESGLQERMAWVYDTGKGYKSVGYNSAAIEHLDHGTLLVPNAPQPAQRTWVGLTRKEVYDLYDSDYVVFHQRIEIKLKEKNNGCTTKSSNEAGA